MVKAATLAATAALGLAALGLPASALAQSPQASDSGGVGSQPASVAEIVAAVGDCFKFVKHHGQIDHEGLKGAGWKFGGKQDVPAKPPMPATSVVMLGKDNVILILRHTGLSATCQTLGRVDDLARSEEIRAGIAASLKAKPAKDYKGDDAFKATMRRLGGRSLDNMLISDEARFTVTGSEKGETRMVSTIVVPRILD